MLGIATRAERSRPRDGPRRRRAPTADRPPDDRRRPRRRRAPRAVASRPSVATDALRSAAPTRRSRGGAHRVGSPGDAVGFVHGDRHRAAARPLAERALARARPRRAAVGHPAVLRHRSRRWTTSSASGWASRTSTRREQIVEAGVESLREGRTHYTSQLRHDRAAAGARPTTSSGATASRYDPATEILITVGASEAVDLALRATCDPGDEVILHEPSYVAYVPAIVFAGGVVRHVATRFEDDFALDPAAVEAAITPRTKALFLGYPCNPTGAVLPDDVQDELGRHRRSATTCSSTATRSTTASPTATYRHRAISALPGMRERTILMGGFSKAYAMTGWRVGYVCGAGARSSRASSRSTSTGSCRRPTTAQDAALAALVDGEPDVERDASPSTTAAGGCSSTGSTRIGLRDVRAARRVLRLPADQLDRTRPTTSSRSAC